jgi:hypothetical protein
MRGSHNAAMNLFHQLPSSRRSPAGLEWALWKRLPAILAVGTLLPLVVTALVHLIAPAEATAQEARDLLQFDYVVAGWIVFHWTLVLTVASGCFIVRVMKGPAYVADAYWMEASDVVAPPLSNQGAKRAPDDRSSHRSPPD